MLQLQTAVDQDAPIGDPDTDAPLAALLSRLAAMQGQALPAYRFAMHGTTAEGLPLAALARDQRAAQMWLGTFAEGTADWLEASEPDLPMPALWLPAEGAEARLLRAALSGQRFAWEDAQGHSGVMGAAELRHGALLRLQVRAASTDAAAPAPQTARGWFRHALRQRAGVFAEAVLATLLLSALGVAGSLYTMQVYDRVVPNKGYATLTVLTVGVALAILLELAMKQVRAVMVDRACKAIDEELSGVFFQKALSIRMDARPRTVGTFAAQIRQFEMVRNFMTSTTLFILADAPFALLFIAIIALIGGSVALVPLLLLPLAALAGLLVHRPLARLTEQQLQESNLKNGLLIESIDGIESVKAVNAEWKMLDRWRELNAVIGARDLDIKGLSRIATHLTATIQQIAYVGLIAAGVFAIGRGELSMGGLIACSLISSRALGPIAQIPQLIVQWQHARVALKALDQVMALPSDGDGEERRLIPEHCVGQLRLEQAAFAYDEQRSVLQVSALEIRPGERVAIVGAVGSGKSTLLKLLTGLYRPSAGRIFLDGVDMSHLAPGFVREHIGYLPQEVRLFKGTLRENLALGLPAPSDAQILAAARLTGLDQIIAAHPRGLGLEISEGGRGLSGGQKQLVGLTRLLLARPRVMLLDEPTASLDGDLETRVMEQVFRHAAPDAVLVVVTHKLSLLPHVDRLILVERGRVLLDGPRDEVLAALQRARTSATPPAPPARVVHPAPEKVAP